MTSPPPATAGLSDPEAERVRARTGANEIPERPPPGVVARVGAQLRDPMILLLLGAAVLTIVLGDFSDLAVIGGVIVLNTLIGVVQELRAEHALAALRAMNAPVTRVWRDAALAERPASELVPGDRIELAAGDIVPADAELLESADLAVDESSLTGESVPVRRWAGGREEGSVQAGTVVLRGRASARVTATGPRSAMGEIALMLGGQRTRMTPLQERLRRLGGILAVTAAGLSLLVLLSDVLRGRSLANGVLTAISLAVAAVPESLPAVVTLALALGARRMARHHAIVRGLPAVETLGSVTVLATDKTGTLTEGRMMVERVWVDGRTYEVTGRGYAPEGTVAEPGTGVAPPQEGSWPALLRDVVLCNDADLRPPDADHPEWGVRGDTLEGALLALAGKAGSHVTGYRRVAETPFDSVRKRMTTVHEAESGRIAVTKGAPEVLLDGPLRHDAEAAAARAAAHALAEDGYRVLAVAEGPAATAEEAEGSLHLVGLVGISDPLRSGARAAIEAVRTAGVEVVMVTGDHPATARAVADRAGLAAGRVVTGSAIEEDERDRVSVFARTRPEQKVDVVGALQARGHVVAVTGDGVNDAPALRRADIGVAMGGQGTEVAKQAADLVLTDDELGTVVTAIAEGRRVYANIRTFLRYGLSGGLAEVLVMLSGPFLGLAVPLLPAQILWINLITHGVPGVAFGAEPGDPEAVRRPPRPPDESVLGGGLARRVLVTGLLIAVTALVAGRVLGDDAAASRTAVFVTLGMAQLGVAVALRRSRPRGRPVGFLDVAVLGAVLLQLAALRVGPLAELLGVAPLSWGATGLAAAMALVPGALVGAGRYAARLGPDHHPAVAAEGDQ